MFFNCSSLRGWLIIIFGLNAAKINGSSLPGCALPSLTNSFSTPNLFQLIWWPPILSLAQYKHSLGKIPQAFFPSIRLHLYFHWRYNLDNWKCNQLTRWQGLRKYEFYSILFNTEGDTEQIRQFALFTLFFYRRPKLPQPKSQAAWEYFLFNCFKSSWTLSWEIRLADTMCLPKNLISNFVFVSAAGKLKKLFHFGFLDN